MPINPPTAVLTDLQTQQFTATSDRSPVSAVWTINPAVGTIDPHNGLYIAPGLVATAQDIVVTATPATGGPASVGVIRLQPRVAITPTSVSLKAGQTQNFEATVMGDGEKGVIWVVSPSLGTMTAGSYKAPDVVKESETITVSVKSIANLPRLATATVQLIPAQPVWTWILGVGLYLVFLFILVWPLVKLWPSALPEGSGEDLITAFGKFPITRDKDLILLVLLAGALGAWIHVGRSYVDFVGNRAFRTSWVPWYLLHPMLGSGLALIFYLGVRGGFFISGTKGTDVNPYGVTAVAGLVGLFSKQATNKLSELFDTLFKTEKGKELRDKLDPQAKTG